MEREMTKNSLEIFAQGVRRDWGAISTEVVAAANRHLEWLLQAAPSEEWLASLHRDGPANRELYRDDEYGFILLAHTEANGLYRPPHDHGRSWVVYGVQRGVSEMTTYARIENPDGSARLVKRGSTLVRPGQVQVYLPGDIHDTRCVEGPALLYRFTERDLKKEDQEDHKITRFVERDGNWVTP
jgi:hypothetical protein